MRDEGFHFLDEIESICLSAREDRRVGPGLIKRHARLIGDLKPPHPFDVHVAFPAGQEQAHRIAVTGHDPFAVLIERNHGVVQSLCQGHAAAQVRGIGAFGDNPFCFSVDTRFVEQAGERNACPFGTGNEAVQSLNAGLNRLVGKHRRAVAAAFDEGHTRDHRITRKGIQREHQGLFDEAVDDQTMFVRIDIGIAGMRNHKMQRIRRKCPVEQMVRSARMLSSRLGLGVAERTHHLVFKS